MPGSRTQEWEHWEVVFRVRSCECIEIIAKVIAVSMGIPADLTVRLAVDPVAFTVPDSVLPQRQGRNGADQKGVSVQGQKQNSGPA